MGSQRVGHNWVTFTLLHFTMLRGGTSDLMSWIYLHTRLHWLLPETAQMITRPSTDKCEGKYEVSFSNILKVIIFLKNCRFLLTPTHKFRLPNLPITWQALHPLQLAQGLAQKAAAYQNLNCKQQFPNERESRRTEFGVRPVPFDIHIV